jgi:hypothetical protein
MANLFHALQRIPDELAKEIGAGEALVVGPCGVKARDVWPVGLGRDGGGAFLGRGWPEFAAAHGVGADWHLALRHRGRGVLTVKAFDDSCCIRGLGVQQPAAAGKDRSSFPPTFEIRDLFFSWSQRNYPILFPCKCRIILS